MNYYYDILINLSETNAVEFYEWLETDPIEHIKKIPVFRVKTKVLKDFLSYNIILNNNLLEEIYLKTEINDNKLTKKIEYMFLLTDTKSVLAIEAGADGRIICQSKLLLNDELNILEISFAFDEKKIIYEKLDKKDISRELRIENTIKKFLLCEIKTLYEKNIVDKLNYIYYEWSGELCDDIDMTFEKLEKLVNKNFSIKHYEIYELIKLSYQLEK